MRQILVLAALVLAGGIYAARVADRTLVEPAPQAAAAQADEQRSASVSYGRTLTVDANRQGHFEVEARIDGRFVNFMVDTGASLVILRETDAANAGIRPMPRDYTATVSTANGKIKAAPAKGSWLPEYHQAFKKVLQQSISRLGSSFKKTMY